MTRPHRPLAVSLVALVAFVCAAPASAQSREGVIGELLKDVAEVEKKIVALARAMPAASHDWRPAKGVRSTGEVLQHIAADNYFLPVLADMPAPPESGITKDYKTVQAFEKKTMSRDALLAELEKSFTFLRNSMASTPDAKADATIDMFGQKSTLRGLWITTATHLHEHLGQLIAYARSNNITPPWSK